MCSALYEPTLCVEAHIHLERAAASRHFATSPLVSIRRLDAAPDAPQMVSKKHPCVVSEQFVRARGGKTVCLLQRRFAQDFFFDFFFLLELLDGLSTPVAAMTSTTSYHLLYSTRDAQQMDASPKGGRTRTRQAEAALRHRLRKANRKTRNKKRNEVR